MSPFLETLAAAVGLVLALTALAAALVGAGKRMQARHNADETEARERSRLEESLDGHEDECAADRKQIRTDLDEVRGKVRDMLTEKATLERVKKAST